MKLTAIVFVVLFHLTNLIIGSGATEKSPETTAGGASPRLDIDKKIISIPNVPKPTSPYNQLIQFGQMLYMTGQLGVNLTTRQLISDDVRNQTQQALRNVETLLHAAGSDLTKLLQCRVFLTDINDYQIMNEMYASFFSSSEDYPVRTTVAVTALASSAKVEIECTAFTTRPATSNIHSDGRKHSVSLSSFILLIVLFPILSRIF